MRLTDDQLDALKWGSFEPRGDLGRVTRFPTFFFFRKYNSKFQKLEGNCGQNAISKRHHWGQIPLAKQHSQVHLLWSASYIQLLEYPIPLPVRLSVRPSRKRCHVFQAEGPIDRGAAKF